MSNQSSGVTLTPYTIQSSGTTITTNGTVYTPISNGSNGFYGTSTAGTTIYTNPPYIYPTSNVTYTSISPQPYLVMDLPKNELPKAVYVCGRMVTLGLLGTQVECAYAGEYLVFEPGVVVPTTYGRRITIIIEFSDEICHYNVGDVNGALYSNNSSLKINAELVSTIKK